MTSYILGRTADFPPGCKIRVEVEGRAFGIYNLDGEYYALLDRCPHQGASLCRGDKVGFLYSDEPGQYNYTRPGEVVRCPWHNWEFDIRTGQSWCDPERTKVRSYDVAVKSGNRLVKGPYKAETFEVTIEDDYVILNPGAMRGDGLLDLEVVGISQITSEVKLLELAPLAVTLPCFTAGAHIDVHLAEGLVRSYSLINAPAENGRYRIAVARDRNSRGGSAFIHEAIHVGDILVVSQPKNNFVLDETAAHSVLIGGGIGITPLMAMVARLEQLGRSWTLHYACRSRSDVPFADTLGQYGGRVEIHCDDENEGRFLDIERIVAEAPGGSHLYCCGPHGMLDVYRSACAALDSSRVHFEVFAARQSAATQNRYEVELARSNVVLQVPEGETILQAVTRAGIDVPHDCTQGICGTCETRVLDGVPDHRDELLGEAERASGKTMMICCSGSRSQRLVLDL